MIDLNYSISGQSITKHPDNPTVYSKTRGVVQLVFSFAGIWQEMKQKAVGFRVSEDDEFDYYPVQASKVTLPDAYCDKSFDFTIVGQNGSQKIETVPKHVEVRKCRI